MLSPRVSVVVAAALFGALLLLPARGGASVDGSAKALSKDARGPVRIGLVFDVGGRGDKSFNDAAYAGVRRAERELHVQVELLEPSGSEDREAGLRLFAAEQKDLVLGVGFIFSSDVDQVARAYPNVQFACIDYFSMGTMPPNVAGLVFKEEEGSFLVGAVAGLMTKTKTVSFVGGMTGPLIKKFEVGYEAGVRATCAECTVLAAYAGTSPDAYRDPAKGKSIATAQIARGADILYHASGATGHGVFEAAKAAHVFAIGVDSDQYEESPDAVLTSMVKRADVAVFETVRAAVERRFEGGMRVHGLAENGVDYVHEGAHAAQIPASVKARVAELRAEIVAGTRVVPSR